MAGMEVAIEETPRASSRTITPPSFRPGGPLGAAPPGGPLGYAIIPPRPGLIPGDGTSSAPTSRRSDLPPPPMGSTPFEESLKAAVKRGQDGDAHSIWKHVPPGSKAAHDLMGGIEYGEKKMGPSIETFAEFGAMAGVEISHSHKQEYENFLKNNCFFSPLSPGTLDRYVECWTILARMASTAFIDKFELEVMVSIFKILGFKLVKLEPRTVENVTSYLNHKRYETMSDLWIYKKILYEAKWINDTQMTQLAFVDKVQLGQAIKFALENPSFGLRVALNRLVNRFNTIYGKSFSIPRINLGTRAHGDAVDMSPQAIMANERAIVKVQSLPTMQYGMLQSGGGKTTETFSNYIKDAFIYRYPLMTTQSGGNLPIVVCDEASQMELAMERQRTQHNKQCLLALRTALQNQLQLMQNKGVTIPEEDLNRLRQLFVNLEKTEDKLHEIMLELKSFNALVAKISQLAPGCTLNVGEVNLDWIKNEGKVYLIQEYNKKIAEIQAAERKQMARLVDVGGRLMKIGQVIV